MKKKTRFISLTASLALIFSTHAAASPEFMWQNHHNPTSHHSPHHQSMGKHSSEHSGYREYRPRNAALNYLRMDKKLNFSKEQKAELRKLRDDWIENQTVPQEQLKVARPDLIHMIYNNTDSAIIEKQLKMIGKLEGELWRAFVDHYKSIMNILTEKQQKIILKGRHSD